ncbi:UNVERIFIED_CONTAM: hypothetical protein Slati_1502700, partial [Sesamum latifolium]
MRSSLFWTCKSPMLTLQTPLPNLLPLRRKILFRTQVEAEVKRHPPITAIDSSEGGVFGEGKTEEKKEDAPTNPEGPSNDPPAPATLLESAPPPPTSSGSQEPEGPACGEN